MRSSIAALELREDVELVPIVPPPDVSLAWWRQTKLVRLARERADVIHSWTSAFPLRSEIPVVQTVHEAPWRHGADENAGLTHRLWARVGRSRAALVVTPSATVAADLGGHANLRVIPWGVDPAFSPDHGPADIELRKAVPHLPEGPFVLCLGGARPKKRLDLVVAGAAASTPPLDVVCSGPTTPESEALAATYPGLLLTGVLDPSLIPALMRASSCSAILSTSEGFGLPALESLRCGTPLVVARGTVQAETSAGFGIEVNPIDPASVAAGFAEAREESETSARRAGGLAHAEAMTWERTAGELVSAWETLI